MAAGVRAGEPRQIEPLMGWTSSADMRSRSGSGSTTQEEAVAYAERNGIPYRVVEPQEPKRRGQILFRQFHVSRRAWTIGRMNSRSRSRQLHAADCWPRSSAG